MVTTLTTCGSFAIGATSPLPLVQSFCIFAAVVVLAPRPWSELDFFWLNSPVFFGEFLKKALQVQNGVIYETCVYCIYIYCVYNGIFV